MRQRRGLLICSAVMLSFGIHIAAATLLLAPTDKGAASSGGGRVSVTLGPRGGAPGSEQTSPDESNPQNRQTMAEAGEPPDPPAEADETSQPEAVETLAPVPAEDIDARVSSEMPVSDMVSADPPASPNTDSVPEPVPPIPKAAPAFDRQAPHRAVTPPRPKPRPMTKKVTKVVAKAVAGDPTRKTLSRQSASPRGGDSGQSGAAGQSARAAAGDDPAGDDSAGDDSAGDGRSGASATYIAQVQDWLEKHKRYPRRAKLRHQQGVVLLRFVVSSAGKVLDFDIDKSSGHSLLDEEVGEMLRRAQPFPKMPPDMRKARLELVVPVQFSLR